MISIIGASECAKEVSENLEGKEKLYKKTLTFKDENERRQHNEAIYRKFGF